MSTPTLAPVAEPTSEQPQAADAAAAVAQSSQDSSPLPPTPPTAAVEEPVGQALLSLGGACEQEASPEGEQRKFDPWMEPYYLEKGLRRVAPYHFTYKTYCKERWRGREILEIFGVEFRDRPKEYYKQAIEEGNLRINGRAVTVDTPVKNGDCVSHTLHRHEPPVTSLPIGIIHEDDNMIVIDKPAGVPVHPAGRYNHNSIIEMMRAERGNSWNPLPCNRLDRLTSGVMFIGKKPKAAEAISQQLRARTVQKEYIARVRGKFPDGVVLCDQPILKISPVLGLNRVRSSGKEARTKFRRLAYYPPRKPASPTGEDNAAAEPLSQGDELEGYSIVHCLPLTGRTHQIRVHLQYLGHPITNDPIYSNRRVFGDSLGKANSTGDDDAQVIFRLSKMGKSETADALSYQTLQTPPPACVTRGSQDPDVLNSLLAREHESMVNGYLKRKGEKMSGLRCDECGTELYTDPGVHELGIFLHAVAYADKTGRWKYRSKMPHWAMPPPGCEGPTKAPDWQEDEGEEVVIGQGRVEGETAIVEGLGTINIDVAAEDAGNAGAGPGA